MQDQSVTPTRERILETSRVLFARQGFHGSSIRDIAGELNVSVSAVYNHFKSKDAILLEVLRRPIVETSADIAAELERTAGADPRERLAACLRTHYRRLIDYHLDAALINSEYLRLAESSRREMVQLRNRYEDVFRRLLLDCLPPIEGKAPPEVAVAMNILLGLTGNNYRWFRPDGPMSSEDMIEFYVRFAMGGVSAALGLQWE